MKKHQQPVLVGQDDGGALRGIEADPLPRHPEAGLVFLARGLYVKIQREVGERGNRGDQRNQDETGFPHGGGM